MDVVSVRPSLQVHALQTAVVMKRPSVCVLGEFLLGRDIAVVIAVVNLTKTGMSQAIRLHGKNDSGRTVLMLLVSCRLSEDRVGDICNACVLLVKRWKKLPNGSKKNWNHVSSVYMICLPF